MSHYSEPPSTVPTAGARGTSGWVGWIAFASLVLFMLGTFHIIQGIAALVKDDYFAVSSSGLMVHVSYTTWGWTHIVEGVVLILAGVGILAGQMWARVVGTALAVVSAVISLAFMPAYPILSVLMITLAVVVIMALTVHGSEIRAGDRTRPTPAPPAGGRSHAKESRTMTETNIHGPLDFVLLEFSGDRLTGRAAQALLDLVEAGIVRLSGVLVAGQTADRAGARSGLLSDEDMHEAAKAMAPGTLATLIVYENTWAIPFVAAAREAGGEMIASARIPAQDVMDALDALEALEPTS